MDARIRPHALIGGFSAAASLATNIGAFEPRDGLLEALLGVAVARIVACMLAADARHLLLEQGEALESASVTSARRSALSCSSRLRFGSARKR